MVLWGFYFFPVGFCEYLICVGLCGVLCGFGCFFSGIFWVITLVCEFWVDLVLVIVFDVCLLALRVSW